VKTEAKSEDLSKAGLPAALFGGLACHPLGGLKGSTCPPDFTRHSCGGCGGLIRVTCPPTCPA